MAGQRDDKRWADRQKRINDLTTAATATGAAALGGALAGKTKVAGKVLPRKVHAALRTDKADDVRNTIALASMVGGTVSGLNWRTRLSSDAMDPQVRASNVSRAVKREVTRAVESEKEKLAKGMVSPTTATTWGREGMKRHARRGYYARPKLPARIRASRVRGVQ